MDKRRRNRWIVGGAIVGGLVMLGTIGGDGGAVDSVIGTAVLAAWIIGVVRLFQGGHQSLGTVAVFIPGVFVAGYFRVAQAGHVGVPSRQAGAARGWPTTVGRWRRWPIATRSTP